MIGGRFFYSYSTDWQSREHWDRDDIPAPPICSMGYMTTRTPLDSDSWKFCGGFFLNAGESGMDWCNNHTHVMEYGGRKYILHHTMHIQERMTTKDGFRCMCADELPYSEAGFPLTKATRNGVEQIRPLSPFEMHTGAEMCTCAEMWYEECGHRKMAVKSLSSGAWTYVRGVDFGTGVKEFHLTAKGKGTIEIRLDERDSEPVACMETASDDRTDIFAELTEKITGIHDLYFVFSDKNICLKTWRAE